VPNLLVFSQFGTHKLAYRRYAGLYFCFCIDIEDNELAALEGIHLFVEILDLYFRNVCELDLVFNFWKVRFFTAMDVHLGVGTHLVLSFFLFFSVGY
jgi:hypothetical protein